MKIYKLNNATIRIQGEIKRECLQAATINFMKKLHDREATRRERIQNGNSNKS